MLTRFTQDALHIIKSIPHGRVLTYGRVAALAGRPGGTRQISRILHAMSEKYELPWHRVINSKGRISLGASRGRELQQALLESEGIEFSVNGSLDLKIYMWQGPDCEVWPAHDFF
jgi:methylated-DNA-protein-cysteine methyltransferase-like protein